MIDIKWAVGGGPGVGPLVDGVFAEGLREEIRQAAEHGVSVPGQSGDPAGCDRKQLMVAADQNVALDVEGLSAGPQRGRRA
jgi:hypothetical protein